MTKKSQARAPYAGGNRLPLPTSKGWKAKHNLYLARPVPDFDPDFDVVRKAVDLQLENTGLGAREIDAFPACQLDDAAHAAALRLAALFEPKGFVLGSPDILCTNLAPVHTDDSFAGLFFISLVLEAGPCGYLFQSFHTEVQGKTDKWLELVVDERVLHAGDVLVFDPTTPHAAAPLEPESGTTLVMLQREIKVPDMETYERLLEALPPDLHRDVPASLLM